jgi:hypothetical protein
MLKGTFDLHTGPDGTISPNVHPNKCMPSSSEDDLPNLEAISGRRQRLGRHPTDVDIDLDHLKMVSGECSCIRQGF